MSTVTESDLKELKDFITVQFSTLKAGQDKISEQIKTLEIGQARIEEKLTSEVKRIDDRLNTFNTSIQKIADLAEKVGELKNWKQIGVIIITALISSILTGSIGGIIGYLIKGSRP